MHFYHIARYLPDSVADAVPQLWCEYKLIKCIVLEVGGVVVAQPPQIGCSKSSSFKNLKHVGAFVSELVSNTTFMRDQSALLS